jgi:hypothetical protein
LVRFLGPKMGDTCRGLHTRSEDHLLSFPTPTAMVMAISVQPCAELAVCCRIELMNGLTLGTIMDSGQIVTSSTCC